jgi:hypothetical protein
MKNRFQNLPFKFNLQRYTGCQIGYNMDYAGCHQLNRVLTHNNNVGKSAIPALGVTSPALCLL